MTPSSTRVAHRWLFQTGQGSRYAAGTDADIKRFEPELSKLWVQLDMKLNELRFQDGYEDGTHYKVRAPTKNLWASLIRAGFKVADGVLSTRSIPSSKTKSMEMAYRLFANSSRQPKDMYKWWEKNQKRVSFILEATRWPEKQMGTDELFELGSFTIHNTVGATGTELEGLKRAIERAEQLAKTNPVPGFRKAVYGDVHIVAKISRAHDAAWYYVGDDSLYLRRSKRTGMSEVHALIHELGHRYWEKFASNDKKREWNLHHLRAEGKEVEVDMPEVGDPLPVRIPRRKGFVPVVEERKGDKYYFLVPMEDGDPVRLDVKAFSVYKILANQMRATKNFPTTYSSTNAEEHFCDSLALAAMNSLDDEYLIPFNAIWNA